MILGEPNDNGHIKFFGEWGPDPDGGKREKVSTPVGELCIYCEEAISERDRGVTMVAHLGDGDGDGRCAYHRCCFVRSISGSVGHQYKRCPCYGGTEEDPPGMTRREAAQAACLVVDFKIPPPAGEA